MTDAELITEALLVLEYVTFHDGRYGQERNLDFQTKAQQLVPKLAKRLGRIPYKDYVT